MWKLRGEETEIAEEKATNEALIKNFDDIKARIEADRILAEKLQEQEREQFTIEERAKFLHDTIAAQRKFLAQQRSDGHKKQTSNQESIKKSDDDLLKAYEDFIAIGSVEDESLIKRMNKKDSSKGEEIKQESKEECKEVE
ncbi:hypothetical protein Tco_0911444 [Tanacetum coccineum]|uniref:Uncharacterized protein n=1 Tax=Tanacetum coccineum TaxID=301880 RepID=A0ABQ5D219_9ASTR